jgi:hypothetical protein
MEVCWWRQLIFLLRDALQVSTTLQTANKAVTLLMQHEVQCICSVPKLSLNTDFERLLLL